MRPKSRPLAERVAIKGHLQTEERSTTYPLVITLVASVLCLALSACAADAHLSDVRFRIVAQDSGEPLRNRPLDIYHFVYDVQYDAKDVPWYITSVTTTTMACSRWTCPRWTRGTLSSSRASRTASSGSSARPT